MDLRFYPLLLVSLRLRWCLCCGIWGREASSFRHVLGLHASGTELSLFYELPVPHGNVPLVFHSMLRLSGHSAQWLSQRGRWEVLGLGLVHLHCGGGPNSRNLSPIPN
jgi:hypothetical protein